MRRQKFLRFLGEAFVVCLLSVSLPAFAQDVPVPTKEWAAKNEAIQIKLDHLKETQKGDVESLNKRIDDTLTMTGQAVDRFGVITAWIGGLVTALLAGLGLLGFITVTRKTKAEAEDAAQAWFNEKASTLLQEIEQLEQRARDAHTHVAASVKSVDDHASAAKQAMDRQQAAMGQAPDAKTQRSTQNSADAATLQQRDAELQQQPETSYSFDDWNARAHAAYAADKLTDAIYFWERASQVKGAGAANVAQALFNKGVTQGQAGDSAGEIESYNEVIRRYGDAPEAALRERVAKALYNKGVRQGQAGDSAGEIESYNEVIRRYGDAPEAALREQVAMALNYKGVTQGQAGDNAGEIESYNEVIRRYGDAPEAALREQVAKALVNKGFRQGQAGDNAGAIESYNEVIRRYGDAPEAALRERVAKALYNKGVRQGQAGDSAGEIESYNEVIRRYGDAPEAALREQVAMALNYKGVTQGQAGDNAGEIESYNEVIRRYGDAPEAALREQVAKALVNKGVRQGQAGDNAGAIESYNEVIRRYGDAPEAALRKQVAKALVNKGFRQGQAGDSAGKIESYNELIRRYGDAPEAELCEEVAIAYNGLGWSHFVEAKRLWKTNRVAAEQCLQQARQQFDFGVNRMVTSNGMILGNRAYARFLQGDTEGAETDYGAALIAKIYGGQSLYDATLKDLDLHPLDEDSGMRTMVDRLWQDYKAAGKA